MKRFRKEKPASHNLRTFAPQLFLPFKLLQAARNRIRKGSCLGHPHRKQWMQLERVTFAFSDNFEALLAEREKSSHRFPQSVRPHETFPRNRSFSFFFEDGGEGVRAYLGNGADRGRGNAESDSTGEYRLTLDARNALWKKNEISITGDLEKAEASLGKLGRSRQSIRTQSEKNKEYSIRKVAKK